MALYIDSKSKKAGDAEQGKSTARECVRYVCHGLDGKAEETPPLGELANASPWEGLHKILYGQPSEEMPALSALEASIPADVLTYRQHGLPVEKTGFVIKRE